MKDAILVKILVEEKALVKLLKTIGRGREYATRALLTKVGAYGYGHKFGTEKGFGRTKNC